MYKNPVFNLDEGKGNQSFNPCFNGSMYKNSNPETFSIASDYCFNPCFNGSMYKNAKILSEGWKRFRVSILVLMDLCIKTLSDS